MDTPTHFDTFQTIGINLICSSPPHPTPSPLQPNVKALLSSTVSPIAVLGQAPPRRKSITPSEPTNHDDVEAEPAMVHIHRPMIKSSQSRSARAQYYPETQLSPVGSAPVDPKSRTGMRKSTAFMHATLDSDDEEFTKAEITPHSAPISLNNGKHLNTGHQHTDNDENDVSVVDTGMLTNDKARIVPKISATKKSTQVPLLSPTIIILVSLLIASFIFISTLLAREGAKAYQLSLFTELNREQRAQLMDFKNDIVAQLEQKRAQFNGINLVTEEQTQFWATLERLAELHDDNIA